MFLEEMQIQVFNYSLTQGCFIASNQKIYEIGYLLDLIKKAHTWNDEILEAYTAEDVLLSIADYLGLNIESIVAKHFTEGSYNEVFEALVQGAKWEKDTGIEAFARMLCAQEWEEPALKRGPNRVERRKNKRKDTHHEYNQKN
ncbi:MAG: hypothetical protein K2H85_02380 [Allobaculum sp.]|nr:hypothetical protein [Allobaculum sp.]